ncbi:hypothetical protein BHK98_01120 [Hornefia porci]|uniref:Uncharacterized protein n=1 Tax=Hornefia porci TaxID=2652292 RepID=A0A1Q9JF29_9FIRM|nr:hypothetical protein [Hornefia porci]OLR54805.1 hypothetical protein BHK98_01120 [Hornefia porci]
MFGKHIKDRREKNISTADDRCGKRVRNRCRKHINNRRGSYLVEAAVVVPFFIIAVMLLIGIIPVISTCERITFDVCEEVRLEMAKSAVRSSRAALPLSVQTRVPAEEPKVTSFRVAGFRYRFEEDGIGDRIELKFRAVFHEKTPVGAFGRIRFDGIIEGRAFTGTYYRGGGGGGGIVCIFPKAGRCYHSRSCSFVKANCHQTFLSEEIRRKYRPCPNCRARKAAAGSPVFVFEDTGKAYHLAGCNAVSRYYIETDKNRAAEKGYVPCGKCGGVPQGASQKKGGA